MADVDRLTSIIRERYEIGTWQDALLTIRHVEDLPWESKPQPQVWEPDYVTHAMALLIGIPIMTDETMPQGKWTIVDRRTGEILDEGTFDGGEE